MYCMASRYQASPQSMDEIIRTFQEQAVPLVSTQPGFRGVYLMTKPEGQLLILNIWDTEEQAVSWPQNPKHIEVVSKLRPFFQGTPVRDGYTVSAYAVH